MSRLRSAHRGYEYQDLLVACRFVDMLLGNVVHACVDQKLVDDDRFDDLTTVDVLGNHERIQFKHTANDDQPLALSMFTTDQRRLRLDRLIRTVLLYRDSPGRDADTLTFRIVLRDQAPVDRGLTRVLRELDRDPGPFLIGIRTIRLGFDVAALWDQRRMEAGKPSDCPFAFLFTGDTPLTYDNLNWACERLVVEVGAPPASGDLTEPDLAERLLLERVRAEVGAESFPNVDRSAVDVAAAMISTARASRQGRLVPTVEELLRRAQLQSDFGAVSRAHPVDPNLEVFRPTAVQQLVEVATELADAGGYLLVVGPPGHGKSWICQQLLEALCQKGWLTAEHYCYLGDADGERSERVLAESVFGSLVGRLAEADPRLVVDHRPRFAADEDALVGCLQRSLDLEPSRCVALVVDGIDHITRVRARHRSAFDPSRSLAESISSLDLPPRAVVIVLSQPGSHLGPLEEAGATSITIPGLDDRELRSLAERLNVVMSDKGTQSSGGIPLIEDAEVTGEFLGALAQRSAGNALYATYLCREMLRQGDIHIDPAAAVRYLPSFDGTLKNYYDHLYETLGPKADWVADVIALIDFAVTRADFREIRPDCAHHVDGALAVLGPVLIERATQGGIRVYHESFARYLRGRIEGAIVKALLDRIADWLDMKGMFVDPRAFRSLPAILSQAGRDERVVDLIDRKFVNRAVAAGFPASGITANLVTAIGSAARLRDWPSVVRYVELARAADSYQSERFDSTLVAFADIPASLLGADKLATRLVDDDRLVMPARAGLQMCAAVDALGAPTPWRAYMKGYLREAEADNTVYGEESDRAVALAWLRGRLRLAALDAGTDLDAFSESSEGEAKFLDTDGHELDKEWDPTAPVNWIRLAEWIEDVGLPAPEVVDAVADTYGLTGVLRLIDSLQRPGDMCLALAERLASDEATDSKIGSPLHWATEAVARETSKGSAHRLLRLGVEPDHLARDPISVARKQLLDLTRRVQEPSIQWEEEHVGAWLDACALAAHRDPLSINIAEALIVGDGWYRCWLRFVLALSQAEATGRKDLGSLALDALHLLTGDLNPFSGNPRACDLYSLHGIIRDTITRAIGMLNDDQWEKGLGVLKEVSATITTTVAGELGGPVPLDFLLRIAVDGSSPAGRSATEAYVEGEVVKGSAGRFYADLAEFRLLAARLALGKEDRQRAQDLWEAACAFLTAYGWHKDITVYEVLDPLPTLIKADPARARVRVAAVQGLCKRVALHTDGDETRHAWSRWWELLAKADPVATVHLAVPKLLAKCNDSNRFLYGAVEDVWQEWHERADPFISGAFRLTLDTPLDAADVKQLERLANDPDADRSAFRRLMTWLLARADERPMTYSYSNSAELVEEDDEKVAKLNVFAQTADLLPVGAIRDYSTVASQRSRQNIASSKLASSVATGNELVEVYFPPGLPGLARAIRAWRRRPYNSQSPEWTVERFANVIGYRLIELTAEGRHQEAESALRSLAEGSGFGERLSILRPVAEGLERHGDVRLAAVAYTLTWTSTRGRGGWLTFGGETEIDALQRAVALDPQVACDTVAGEVERMVATSRYGTFGISQGLIHAFTVGALACPGKSSADIAFALWDEAFAVIEARAPRVDVSDDPDTEYRPPDSDSGEPAPGDLDAALALATLGGLAHPGREMKRRAFLAAQLLLDERSQIAAPAFDLALGVISDPATLTWLLRLIESSGEKSLPVRMSYQATLRDLVSRDLITLRALARRLLSGDQPPLAPSGPAHEALLNRNRDLTWLPDNVIGLSLDESAGIDELLETVAGARLRRGERLLRGLRSAVRARATAAFSHETFKKRLHAQLDALANRLRKRRPDAFLAPEEMIEEILQSVAAGGRTARLMSGEPIADPIVWEDVLASALLDDPTVPLTIEATRQPRPHIAPPLGAGHEVWARIRERATGGSGLSIVEASEEDNLLLATLTIEPASSAPVVEGGTFRGWFWLGTMEKRFVKHPDGRRETDLLAQRYRVLEVRDVDDHQTLTLPPVAAGDLRMWRAEVDPILRASLPNASHPLVGEDRELVMVGDGRQGLGVPHSLLTPTASLIVLLELRPGAPCSYEDEDGPALALVTWRAEYDTSDYYLAWPRTCGSGIVIRPDLLATLIAAIGEDRLVLRDFLVGDIEFLSTAAASTPSTKSV